MVVLLNKQDLPWANDSEDLIHDLELEEIKDRNWEAFPCSVREREGVEESLIWLSK